VRSLLIRCVSLYFKYGVPAIVIVVVGYALFEQFYPWKAAESVLPDLPNETRVSIGTGSESRGGQSERYTEYIYFPSHWRDAKVYVVRQRNHDAITLEEIEGSVVIPLVVLLLAIAGSVWFWRRDRRVAQPNTSFEPTREG
jgi:hypothetical protein